MSKLVKKAIIDFGKLGRMNIRAEERVVDNCVQRGFEAVYKLLGLEPVRTWAAQLQPEAVSVV